MTLVMNPLPLAKYEVLLAFALGSMHSPMGLPLGPFIDAISATLAPLHQVM